MRNATKPKTPEEIKQQIDKASPSRISALIAELKSLKSSR